MEGVDTCGWLGQWLVCSQANDVSYILTMVVRYGTREIPNENGPPPFFPPHQMSL
jgi:hypothetical protein